MIQNHDQLMLLLLAALGFPAALLYVQGWHHAARLLAWRRAKSEAGETSISIVIVTVALIAAITVLVALEKEVPTVLSQGLASILFGIAGGEVAMRRGELKAGAVVHPRRGKPKPTPKA